jgi:hypothetical protein
MLAGTSFYWLTKEALTQSIIILDDAGELRARRATSVHYKRCVAGANLRNFETLRYDGPALGIDRRGLGMMFLAFAGRLAAPRFVSRELQNKASYPEIMNQRGGVL